MRRLLILSAVGLFAGFGCGLLQPYPGGNDVADLFSELGKEGVGGGIDPTREGVPQEPLVDPAIDPSVVAETPDEVLVANPGQPMIVRVDYVAARRNVIGGGIRFGGSDEVQWTLIDSLRGTAEGTVEFAYSIPDDICDGVPNLCHEHTAELFAVAQNGIPPDPPADVDGDGVVDGTFVVSAPARPYQVRGGVKEYVEGDGGQPRTFVRVVLRCASCESDTCRDLLAEECSTCTQPLACQETFDLCFGPGRPKEDTNESDLFLLNFGPDGLTWRVPGICIPDKETGATPAEDLCQDLLDAARNPTDVRDNCIPEDDPIEPTATDGMTSDGGTGTSG